MTALMLKNLTIRVVFSTACLLTVACGGEVEGAPFLNIAGDADNLVPAPDEAAGADTVATDTDTPDDGDARAPGDSVGGGPIVPQPLRLVLVFSSHGVDRSDCFTDTGATTFAVGPALAPLAPFRERMQVVDGVSGLADSNGAHGWGAPHAFTGSVRQESTYGGESFYVATRPSLDQVLSRSELFISLATAFAPLTGTSSQNRYAVAASDGAPIPVGSDPAAILGRLPGRGPATQGFESWLSTADLAVHDVRAEAHARAIASTLADQFTRAFVYQLSHAQEMFTGGGQSYSYNELAHDVGTEAHHQALVAARAIMARRVAILLTTLASTTVGGDESLLDHTLVVWVDDTGWGPPSNPHRPAAHSNRYLPLIVFTPPGLGLEAPLYLQLGTERPYADFLATIAEAAGIADADLGAPLDAASVISEAFSTP